MKPARVIPARREPDPSDEAAAGADRPYDHVALVLQGGGALGSYQAGVFEGLDEAGIRPNWLAGISIGALNAAIIAGNAPERRVARLREFWETICQPAGFPAFLGGLEEALFNGHRYLRPLLSAAQTASALLQGQRGFFVPRWPARLPQVAYPVQQASYYDTAALRDTLLALCDFDRINSGDIRVLVGAVNVETGDFVYFDNARETLRPEHFMASGALPPGFPPVEIDGQYYWDGGVVSNTPLMEVLRQAQHGDTLVFQVDLWNAGGTLPQTMEEVAERAKDIQYSSRSRLVARMLEQEEYHRSLVEHLLRQIPESTRLGDPRCVEATAFSNRRRRDVRHLIYRKEAYENSRKDIQFGSTTMRQHWESGLADSRAAVRS